jgi:hypothetical protein
LGQLALNTQLAQPASKTAAHIHRRANVLYRGGRRRSVMGDCGVRNDSDRLYRVIMRRKAIPSAAKRAVVTASPQERGVGKRAHFWVPGKNPYQNN